MKTQYKYFIIMLLLIISACSSFLMAQRSQYCGNDQKAKQYYLDFIQSRKTNALHIFPSTVKQARIFFHIVTDDDGSNPAATLKDVSRELDSMGKDYGSGNICFDSVGLNYVASTFLNSQTIIDDTAAHAQRASDSLNYYYVPGCLNLFYVSKIGGINQNSGNPGHGGYSFGCPNPISMITKDALAKNTNSKQVKGHTSSHESGHLLGLMHTYDTSLFPEEYIDGTDSYERGDLMPETQADPYSHAQDTTCFSQNKDRTLYTGDCKDPHGDTNFSPPYNNLMSYWKPAVRVFTDDQFYEVKYNLLTKNADVASADDSYILQAGTFSIGYFYKSAINNLSTNGDVLFSGVVTAGLFGNTVTLKPGFHAQPLLTSVLIKATECYTTGFTATAQTSSSEAQKAKTPVKTTNDANNVLAVYPNPSTGYFNIQYNERKTFDAIVRVRNINGVIVFSVTRKNILKLQERVDLFHQGKGVYFIEAYINGKRLTAIADIQ